MAPAAYHGLTGDVVRSLEPHTESDPAALVMQFLVITGNQMGCGPGFHVEGTRHHVNLFSAIVGDTSKGRKGSSFDQASRAAQSVADGEWHYETGLSSGEGLIWHVRDPIVTRRQAKTSEEKKSADEQGCVLEVTDPGVKDKRLLCYESELAIVLGRMGREGNTLSGVLRQGWDGKPLSTLVKREPGRATGAHISIIAHITEEELRRELTRTEMANGFGNRFLWCCARRSKKLPLGGDPEIVDWRPLEERLWQAIAYAQSIADAAAQEDPDLWLLNEHGFGFSDAARDRWIAAYDQLSEGEPGMFGAVTSRAEAQVRRLAVIYAVLDLADKVEIEHLEAALAVWDYSERSCRRLFGKSLGDPTADTLLTALKRAGKRGLTKTDITNLFDRNKNSDEIRRALSLLVTHRLVYRSSGPSGPSGGRPPERWYAS